MENQVINSVLWVYAIYLQPLVLLRMSSTKIKSINSSIDFWEFKFSLYYTVFLFKTFINRSLQFVNSLHCILKINPHSLIPSGFGNAGLETKWIQEIIQTELGKWNRPRNFNHKWAASSKQASCGNLPDHKLY